MDEPWALDYVTHQNVPERVFMQPGDIVLYEGASMIHGRKVLGRIFARVLYPTGLLLRATCCAGFKDPLRGDSFTNVFFHFRSEKWLPEVSCYQLCLTIVCRCVHSNTYFSSCRWSRSWASTWTLRLRIYSQLRVGGLFPLAPVIGLC